MFKRYLDVVQLYSHLFALYSDLVRRYLDVYTLLRRYLDVIRGT